MRDAVRLPSTDQDSTPDETWAVEPTCMHYLESAKYEALALGAGHNRPVLVVGSPLFQLRLLSGCGWRPTYMDVRTPPIEVPFLRCDATDMRGVVADNSYPAISCNCVICHVGMGRYGDGVVDDGDERLLAEFYRVLEPGGFAAITFGPVVAGRPIVQGNAHRIYTVREAERIAIAAGFEVVTRAVWATVDRRWRRPKEEAAAFGPHDPDYLSMVLAKRTIAGADPGSLPDPNLL